MAPKLKQEPKPDHMNSESTDELPTWSTDIIAEIFSFLPPKSLFRFKSVSKSIRDLTKEADFISKYSINTNHKSSSFFTGLFYQTTTSTLNLDIKFFPTNPDMELPGLGFLKQKKLRSEVHGIQLIASSNGLLLCSTTTNAANPVKTVYVCNPLTRQKVAIPHPQRRSSEVHYALLSNLTDSGLYQFRLVCLYKGKTATETLIYSSDTGAWEEKKQNLPELSNNIESGSKVFFNGRLFWDCFEDHILVCRQNKASGEICFELIEAPTAPRGRCLFISDQSLTCYCHKHDAWCLFWNENKPYWEISEDCRYFKNLKEDISRMCREGEMNLQRWYVGDRYQIINFDHASSTMLLSFHFSIFSYQVKKRRFEVVVGAPPYLTGRTNHGCVVTTYTHCLGRIEAGKGVEKGKERKRGKKSFGVHVEDHHLADWASLMEKNANMVKQRGLRR